VGVVDCQKVQLYAPQWGNGKTCDKPQKVSYFYNNNPTSDRAIQL